MGCCIVEEALASSVLRLRVDPFAEQQLKGFEVAPFCGGMGGGRAACTPRGTDKGPDKRQVRE